MEEGEDEGGEYRMSFCGSVVYMKCCSDVLFRAVEADQYVGIGG